MNAPATRSLIELPFEVQALYLRAAASLNRKPLGVEIADPDDDEYLRPPGVKDFLGTENADQPSRTLEQRITRCYELAAWAIATRAPAGSWLIHGSMHGPYPGNQRIAHAFVLLPGGLIWEPIMALIHDEAAYTRYARVWEERRYNRVVAARLMYESDHHGPWHESRYP